MCEIVRLHRAYTAAKEEKAKKATSSFLFIIARLCRRFYVLESSAELKLAFTIPFFCFCLRKTNNRRDNILMIYKQTNKRRGGEEGGKEKENTHLTDGDWICHTEFASRERESKLTLHYTFPIPTMMMMVICRQIDKATAKTTTTEII